MDLTEQIRPHVDKIKQQAKAGNHLADMVIALHRLHVACSGDSGAEGLCKAAFDAWLKDQTDEN